MKVTIEASDEDADEIIARLGVKMPDPEAKATTAERAAAARTSVMRGLVAEVQNEEPLHQPKPVPEDYPGMPHGMPLAEAVARNMAMSFTAVHWIDGRGTDWGRSPTMIDDVAGLVAEAIRLRDTWHRDALAAQVRANRHLSAEKVKSDDVLWKIIKLLGVTNTSDALGAIRKLQTHVQIWNKDARNNTFVKAVCTFARWLHVQKDAHSYPKQTPEYAARTYLVSEGFKSEQIDAALAEIGA